MEALIATICCMTPPGAAWSAPVACQMTSVTLATGFTMITTSIMVTTSTQQLSWPRQTLFGARSGKRGIYVMTEKQALQNSCELLRQRNELHASLCNEFWNMLHAFWNILHAFCIHSGIFWDFLHAL